MNYIKETTFFERAENKFLKEPAVNLYREYNSKGYDIFYMQGNSAKFSGDFGFTDYDDKNHVIFEYSYWKNFNCTFMNIIIK